MELEELACELIDTLAPAGAGCFGKSGIRWRARRTGPSYDVLEELARARGFLQARRLLQHRADGPGAAG